MDTPSGRKKHALITGASSGIGKEIAKALAAEGYRPILVGRHRDTLEQAAHEILGERGADAIICPADLSEVDAPMMHRSPRGEHLPSVIVMDAASVAHQGVAACLVGDTVCVAGIWHLQQPARARRAPRAARSDAHRRRIHGEATAMTPISPGG